MDTRISEQSNPQEKGNPRRMYYASLGLVFGAILGLIFGSTIGNPALGLIFGAGGGLIFGSTLDQRRE